MVRREAGTAKTPKRAPVSSGGGLAEAIQERRGGSPAAAQRTIAANRIKGYVPRTPTVLAPDSSPTSLVRTAAKKVRKTRQEKIQHTLRKLIRDDTESLRTLTPKEKKLWKNVGDKERDKAIDRALDLGLYETLPGAPKGTGDALEIGKAVTSGTKEPAKAERQAEQIINVAKRSERLWEKAKLPGPMPKVIPRAKGIRSEMIDGNKAAAYVSDGKVKLPKPITRALGRRKKALPSAKQTLLHEFAHTRQRQGVGDRRAEGLADLYARRTAKRLDIPVSADSDSYEPFRKRARKATTAGFQLRGQFARNPAKRKFSETVAVKRPGADEKPSVSALLAAEIAKGVKKSERPKKVVKREQTKVRPKGQEPKKAPPKKEPKAKKKPKKPSLIDSLDREFKPGETVSAKEAALLAEAHGLPGKTYAQIAIGESGMQPAAISSDGGYGLWQMTPRVQSAETKAKWDAIAAKHPGGYLNPVANAEMAAVLASGGTGTSNYYGTGSVTDMDAHVRGGPARAQRKLGGTAKTTTVPTLVDIGKKAQKKFGVEAREQPHFDPVDPVHSTGSMHYSGDAIDFQGTPDQLAKLNKWLADNYGSQTAELFYDPGINIVDGQPTSAIGGHPTHVHFGLTDSAVGDTATSIAGSIGASVSGGATGVASPASAGTPTQAAAKSAKKKKARKLEGRERSKLIRELIAEGPAVSPTIAPTPEAAELETVSLGL